MTLAQLIDNGLLDEVGQITANEHVCCSWRIDNDIILKDDQNNANEIQSLLLEVENNDPFCFRLDAEVKFDGFDLLVVEDNSKTEFVLGFQKIVDIDPESFIEK